MDGVECRSAPGGGVRCVRGATGVKRAISALLFVAMLVCSGCASQEPAPSPAGVIDTAPDFMPPGVPLQGARRRVMTIDPARLSRKGGFSGTFTLTNRGKSTIILASVEPASTHVMASSPGAMPYRVDPGKSFSVTITISVPWDRALTDGGIARVLTTDGDTITLWLQLVSAQPVAPVSAPASAPASAP